MVAYGYTMKIPILILITSCLACQAQGPSVKIIPPVEKHLKNVPKLLLMRCSEDRRYRQIKSHGGNPATEQAVVDALRFLRNTQEKDGSWPSDDTRPVAMTGLALLCFLGHGQSTRSEEFRETVAKAIKYLVNNAVRNKGKLASDHRDDRWPYEHAVGTYALAESYSLCEKGMGEKSPILSEPSKFADNLSSKINIKAADGITLTARIPCEAATPLSRPGISSPSENAKIRELILTTLPAATKRAWTTSSAARCPAARSATPPHPYTECMTE